ncbi:MAG: response regulator [Candidatus Aminicenantales bacterium]
MKGRKKKKRGTKVVPKILVVEDEQIVAMDIQFTLETLGYKVCGIVSSGEESVEKAFRTNPDLILMDIKLKGKMDGISAARQIQSQAKIPVIYITAFGDENTLEKLADTQPYAYINKPFVEHELQSKIKKILKNFENCQFN